MSRLAPRPPQHPAHRRTRSDSQTADKRLELVARLEGCIHEILEATKAYKSPQQQSAHQNANQMFQQRVMASQGRIGNNMSEQDWLGTMMQCLNESMRTQQSSFVRNTTLDVALRTFASGVFEALGLAYFHEPFDKYTAASKPSAPNNNAALRHPSHHSGILSPPRDIGPCQNLVNRQTPHNIPPPPSHHTPFPSAHHQLVQRPAHNARPATTAILQHPTHGMPVVQRPPPPPPQSGRPPKRSSPIEIANPSARKRAYTSEALRQAAGQMGPPSSPAQANPRLCIDFWDVQHERDARQRQAILGYGGKWYVFQCHQHEQVLLFKTAEGARHHMTTRHALPNQRIDFLDIIQELGVEVMNCDVARAEQNNLDAVNMWNRSSSSPTTQQDAGVRSDSPVSTQSAIQAPVLMSKQQKPASQMSHTVHSEPAQLPRARRDSSGIICLSDDEDENTASDGTPNGSAQLLDAATRAVDSLKASQNLSSPVSRSESERITLENGEGSIEKQEAAELPEKEPAPNDVPETSTARSTETPDIAGQIPDLTPDSPDSSGLSEPPSVEDLDCFRSQPVQEDCRKLVDERDKRCWLSLVKPRAAKEEAALDAEIVTKEEERTPVVLESGSGKRTKCS
ncbi:hypothetical protein IF1G_01014 [Cordyceps javanica]|uniref:Uncharacterized protein n=1 Tax=Cordyceps javanica TaxID=43265 RepID=A0A545VH88_9HYPO|nr:hypothetical protein IF1G_01014 [Cordyceps javanica]TQW12243.1 hypothetical protein IF2G_00974 [Cordyceps javanica]